RRVGTGPRLVYLQRRPHEHVQRQRLDPEDAGEVPGALGRRERVRGRGPQDALGHRGHGHFAGTVTDGGGRRGAAIDRGGGRPVRAARLLPVPLPALRGDAAAHPVLGEAREVRPRLFAGRGAALAARVFTAVLREPFSAFA